MSQKRTSLKNSGVFMEEHFSDLVFQRRKTLLPFLKVAKQLKMQAFLNVDKLVDEGNTYEIENLHDFTEIHGKLLQAGHSDCCFLWFQITPFIIVFDII